MLGRVVWRPVALALPAFPRGFATLPSSAFNVQVSIPDNNPATILTWMKASGDAVKAGDSLCELETEQYVMEFRSDVDGYVAKVLKPANSTVVDKQSIAVMVHSEADIDDVLMMDMPADKVMPSARNLLLANELSIADVKGTGKHGRITKGDVLAALGKADASAVAAFATTTPGARQHAPEPLPAAPPAPAPAPAPVAASAPPAPASPGTTVSSTPAADLYAGSLAFAARPGGGTYTDTAPSMMRKVIAKRMVQSKAEVPYFYAVMDAQIDTMLQYRKTLKAAGVNVSVNDLVVKAAARALVAVPEVNCSMGDSGIVANDSVDVSVAVATPGGLITPILKDADKRGLFELNSSMKELATRARAGKLAPEEYQGGTFTVSNLGMFSMDEFTAVINQPQSAILAVGGGTPTAVVGDDDEAKVATVMSVQLSADRRVVDDVTAGQFLQAFKTYVENPALLSA